MKNLENLNSSEWCDIIFEGKNKSYGAFQLRQTSSRRHVAAFGIVLLFVGAVVALPTLADRIKASNATKYKGDMTEIYKTTRMEVKQPEAEVIKPDIPEPPTVKHVKSIKYAPPKIVANDEADEAEMANVSDILNAKDSKVGMFDVPDGSTDSDAEFKKFADEVTGEKTTPKGNTGPETLKFAEIMPQFPGGEAEMYQFIKENLKYPVMDQEVGNQGRVIIRFVVSKTGEIMNVELMKGVSQGCDKEALRVVKSMPKWIPGRQNGDAVQVYFTLPIVFKLN